MSDQEQEGPRGGTTTRRRGQIRKTIWLNEDEAAVLRRAAYEENTSESALVREAIRRYFDLED